MLRLTLWNDAETAQHTIELYDHVPVNLTYQFTDVSEINKSVGSYSQTFRIPATKQNTDFFGAAYDPNIFTSGAGLINGNYNVKRKIRAELSFNSVPLMKGYVQLKAVYLQKESFADIEIVFLSEVIDLAKSLGEGMLSDLDTSAIDHDLNETNVANSWLGLLFSGNVRYGMIDKGRNWSFADPNFLAWSATDGLWVGDLTPYIRAKWLFDQIMTDTGYTYDSALFDTADFQNIYLPAFNGAASPVSSDTEPELQTIGVGLTADFTMSSTYQTVPLVDTDSGGYDYDSNWGNINSEYIAPFTAYYTFSVRHVVSVGAICDVRLLRNATVIKSSQDTDSYSIETLLSAGDVVTLEAKSPSPSAFLESDGSVGYGGGTWMRVTNVTERLVGQTIDMSLNLPEVKQIDFLTGLQKMFNLVFVPDKHKPKHILIEPFNDYTLTGAIKDWSSKVDYTKDIVIKPTADIQAKQYDWTNSNGQDFINILIQESAQRVYGRYRVTDPENDFATGEKTIQTPFSPYLMSNIPSSPFTIYRAIDKDGNGVKTPSPKLAYWNGLTDVYGDWYLRDDLGATNVITHFPHFSNYSAIAPSISDKDLNFGYERAFFYTEAHPLNTLYFKYWQAYVNELYSPEARLLTAYIKLTRADIQDFEFSDKIYIKDSYYRILKISNFDATVGQPVQVELIKVLSDIADCQFTPSFVDGEGTIRFTGGDPVEYGNQYCCERYGYTWRPRIGRCVPQSQLPQPQ